MIDSSDVLGCKRWWRVRTCVPSILGIKRPPPKRGWQATECRDRYVDNAIFGWLLCNSIFYDDKISQDACLCVVSSTAVARHS
jgi:hypothetical protein